jgi:SAM-dependent methyltransferase
VTRSLDADYFTQRYAESADPYRLGDRWYEARKYALTVALLPRERYAAAFEPGCSIGVLTAKLAAHCGTLLACDAVHSAVATARARTANLPGVRVERRLIPRDWPGGEFDLIVFSEILYYFDDPDLNQVLRLGSGALRPDGHLVAVHWRHPAPDHPRTGDQAHRALAGYPGLARLAAYRDPDFAAEVYAPSGGDLRSVAQAGEIV